MRGELDASIEEQADNLRIAGKSPSRVLLGKQESAELEREFGSSTLSSIMTVSGTLDIVRTEESSLVRVE